MSIADQFRTLAEAVERLEADEVVVDDLSTTMTDDGDSVLVADLQIRLAVADSDAGTSRVDLPVEPTELSNGSRDPDPSGPPGIRVTASPSTAANGHRKSNRSGSIVDGETTVENEANAEAEPSDAIDQTDDGGDATDQTDDGGDATDQTDDGGDIPVDYADESVDESAERSGADGTDSDSGTAPNSEAVDGSEATFEESADGSPAGSQDRPPVPCRVEGCGEAFETEHGMKIHATKAHAADGSGRPPHRDPDRLRDVYEGYDTFEEMTDALDVDVTTQTVRRTMIEFGIHEPGRTDPADDRTTSLDVESQSECAHGEPNASDATGPSPEHEPPGLEIPEEFSIEAVIDTVKRASTLYEVQTALELDRTETQSLLKELGVLDLVHGRVATKSERDERKVEIERRIRAQLNGEATAR